MFQHLSKAMRLLITLTVLTGVIYPLTVTLISWSLFPFRASGSLILRDGRPVGSELIGQSFTGPEYFWGRLSATAPVPYNAAASSGSNYGFLHPGLKQTANARILSLGKNGPPPTAVPVDLVTASSSGLDPHISPAAAEFQVSRVAVARRLPEDTVRELVRQYTAGRQFGVLGEPRVNVLLLNLALDELASHPGGLE